MNELIAEATSVPLPRNRLVQECCIELLRHLAGADVDEGKAVVEWLRMKIAHTNVIIMENPVDTREFPSIGG